MKKIIRKFNTARRMPPSALVNIAKRRVRRYSVNVFPIKMSDKQFFNVVDHENLDKLPRFFFDGADQKKIVDTLRNEYPEATENAIHDADEICNHIFDLLGSGKTKLGEEIDWHLDFKSKFRWNPGTYYLWTRKHVTLSDPSDVKVPWELSRCQHFVTLGKAYWFTGNEKYAKEFVRQIEGWIDQNPVEFGVNWACTMDVAIRAVNWIWGCYFFLDSPSLTNKLKTKIFKNLFLHGRHIINSLEFSRIRGNHYLSDIVGLVYLGIFFQNTKDGKNWLEKGLSALKEEMKYQVYPDGVDFEGSISYHRLVTELFLTSTIVCFNNGITFPEWYMNRLEKMIEFVMYYTKPDGTAPQIGDNDDGRLHILSNYGNWNRLDHRHLLATSAILFKRNDFREVAGEFHEEAFLLLGAKWLKRFESLPDHELILCSKAFSYGGFYIMHKNDLYMIIDCVPENPEAPSGHKHNSRLSFELFAYDKSFIIDPGTYVYTSDKEMRNVFRSTKYHNTVVVDDEEQNRFDEDVLFTMNPDATIKVNDWLVTKRYDFLDAEHSGYVRLKNHIIHRREIYFNKDDEYWVIKDTLTGEGCHKFDLYFHFAPMELKMREGFVIETDNKSGANLVIVPLETKGIKMEFEKGWVSYAYGRKVKASIVKYTKNVPAPTSFINVIYPYKENINFKDIIKKAKSDFNAIKEVIG